MLNGTTQRRPTAIAIDQAQVNVTARRNAHAREAALLADYEEQARKNALTIEAQREKVTRCQQDVEVAAERLQTAHDADTLESRLLEAAAVSQSAARLAAERQAEAEARLQQAVSEVEAASLAVAEVAGTAGDPSAGVSRLAAMLSRIRKGADRETITSNDTH